jgi:hypothetical protein
MHTPLLSNAPLFDWFSEGIAEADTALGARLTADARLYLSRMLTERARLDDDAPDTLVELLATAAEAPPGTRARLCREAGDRALHVLGYFRQSLFRRHITPSYYADLGASAYDQARTLLDRFFAHAMADVLDELATRFGVAVRVVERVRQRADASPDPIGRLLGAWERDHDPKAADRLRALGILVPRGPVAES